MTSSKGSDAACRPAGIFPDRVFASVVPLHRTDSLSRSTAASKLVVVARSESPDAVLFTMGSSGMHASLAKRCGCSAIPSTALITTAGLPSEQFAQHRNIFVEKLADGDSLMAASNMTITHGGNGTIYQALGQGRCP